MKARCLSAVCLVFYCWFFVVALADTANATTSYVDEKGTRHFVSGPEEVPERFRNQKKDGPKQVVATPVKAKKRTAAPKPAPAPAPAPAPTPAEPEADKPTSAPEAKTPAPASTNRPPIEYMLRGSFLFDAHDYPQAQKFYEKALAVNATNPQLKDDALGTLYSQLADTYFFQNKFTEAVALMKKALATGKMDTKLVTHNHFNLACAYNELGNVKEATEELKTTLKEAKAVPELFAKYTGMARTDEQLAKVRATPEFETLMKEFGK